MRSLLLLLATITPAAAGAQAGQPVRLKPDQQLTVTGTLTMRPGGRLQNVTVRTAQAYVPVFASSVPDHTHEGKPVHEIALADYDYALLYAHRGQTVTVTGKLLTDDVSPYYRDGMRLEITQIRTVDGADLNRDRLKDAPVAADVGTYHAVAVLPADLAAPWRYTVDGKPDTHRMFSCSSNGGGDVVNCGCTDGFHATAVSPNGSLMDGRTQFGVGDDARAATLSVTCSR